jgi:hypothetical protein
VGGLVVVFEGFVHGAPLYGRRTGLLIDWTIFP